MRKSLVIFLLGTLSVISPFAIDAYLPAFPQLAHSFDVPDATVALTISSYFIGLALGQIFYGPLLDRFGRKPPLFAGLSLFVMASIACAYASSIEMLIALRFIQALGGCVAGVASLAIVHDLFPVEESARILSRMFLYIAVSPLFAPSIGGFIALSFGWRIIFGLLAGFVLGLIILIALLLPESHRPDRAITLRPGPIIREYLHILRHRRFMTYALAGAFSFAGLFTYVAGSPIIFMEHFQLSAKTYSGIFALLATGFIGGSQLNVYLLRFWTSETIFLRLLMVQTVAGLVFVLGAWADWYGLLATLALFFVFLSCAGLTYPNAAALALAPFSKNAGSAAAMLGFLQLGIGAVLSTGISAFAGHDSFPIIALLGVTAALGLIILFFGSRTITPISVTE